MKYFDIGRVKRKYKKGENYTLHVMVDHSRLSDRMLQRLFLLKLKVVKIHKKQSYERGANIIFLSGVLWLCMSLHLEVFSSFLSALDFPKTSSYAPAM